MTTCLEPIVFTAIIQKLNFTGKFRTSHLVPAGFQTKRKKTHTGSLVIWEEVIIGDLISSTSEAQGASRDVVFVSRQQTDLGFICAFRD